MEPSRTRTQRGWLFFEALDRTNTTWEEARSLLEKIVPDLRQPQRRRKIFLQLATYVGGPRELMIGKLSDFDKNMAFF